jgi:predicted permease
MTEPDPEPIQVSRRDGRGTGVFDDAVRDVVYALRQFRRAPLVAFTVVSTVGLGLGLVAVAYTFLNVFLFRVDKVPGVHEMYAVERPRNSDGDRQLFTRAQFDALRRETEVFTDAYAELSSVDARIDGRRSSATLVTGNFFQVLGVHASRGRALAPADDEPLGARAVVVLSDRGWDRLTSRDPAVIGRQLRINGVPFEIVGVMPKGFRGLAVGAPDYWAPLSLVGQFRPIERGREASLPVGIIGRLKPGLSRQSAQAALAVWAARQSSPEPSERSATGVALVPRRGTVPQPLEAVLVTAPLFFAFGLILLIGCANVANLLLARAVSRQREIGIRLSLGAARARLVRQLLTESLLLALVAALAGLALSRVLLRVLVGVMMTSWPPEIGDLRLLVPDADFRVLAFLVAVACVATMLFGLLPALQATRIEPVRTIRGEVVRDARPGRARDLLIGLQVGASALLLICAAVFLRSAFAAATADPGMRTADTVVVGIANEQSRAAAVQAVTAEPFVAAVAASWPAAIGEPRKASAQSAGAKATVAYKLVSPEYFGVLDIPVVRGRAFAPDERTSSLAVAIVSESAARALWPNGDAVGQVVRLERDDRPEARRASEPPLESRTFTVVGVARDVAGFRVAPTPKALVYVPTSAAAAGTALVARVHGDPDRARERLLDRLSSIDPSLDQVGTLRWVTRMETYLLKAAFWLTVGLGALALALTVSGLFSVLSYLVAQRTKEIGVHMALGATKRDVTRLVLSQSTRPVGLGLLLGAASTAGLARLLLATAGADTIGHIVQVLDPVAYAVSLSVIVAACLLAASIPAARAARLDPTLTLRQE